MAASRKGAYVLKNEGDDIALSLDYNYTYEANLGNDEQVKREAASARRIKRFVYDTESLRFVFECEEGKRLGISSFW